jgi:hypothetical protein
VIMGVMQLSDVIIPLSQWASLSQERGAGASSFILRLGREESGGANDWVFGGLVIRWAR